MPELRPSQPANRCATSQPDATVRRAGESVGQGVLDHRIPLRRGATTADVGLKVRHDLLEITRIDERELGPRQDVVSVREGGFVTVRGAPRGMQERDVVGICQLVHGGPGELAETDGESGGTECVLERLPGA